MEIVMAWLALSFAVPVALGAAVVVIRSIERARAERARREMLATLTRLGLGPTDGAGGVPTSATHRDGRSVARIHTPGRR